jgi:cytoskeletal protein RodZ
MALFNRRKQNTDVLPEEVREYYQSERRERTGVAWLLAVATLVATFIIAAALFFSGRWAYRTVFNNDDNKNKTTTSQDNAQRVDENGNVTGGNQQAVNNGSAGQSTGTSSTSTNTPSPSSSTTTNNATTNSTPTSTPNTGPVELINTGPGDE